MLNSVSTTAKPSSRAAQRKPAATATGTAALRRLWRRPDPARDKPFSSPKVTGKAPHAARTAWRTTWDNGPARPSARLSAGSTR
jgi:hypothetical protein